MFIVWPFFCMSTRLYRDKMTSDSWGTVSVRSVAKCTVALSERASKYIALENINTKKGGSEVTEDY
jgi:hypothetical protein